MEINTNRVGKGGNMNQEAKNISENNFNDGFFSLTFEQAGVYLTVYPSNGNGKKVLVSDVLDKLTKKKVKNFNREAVDTIVRKANKMPEKIAEPQEELKFDSTLALNILPDKMKANVLITPPEGGRMLTAQEIVLRLRDSGIVYGIKSETINMLITKPPFNQHVILM